MPVPAAVATVTSTDPSDAANAETSRTFSPAAVSTAATFPRPSSRTRRVETSLSASYRSITATVAEPSRERVRTVFPLPCAYTFVTGAEATGFSPDQNSITLNTIRSSNAATVYTWTMTKTHVAALRTYFSSIDWFMSYTLRVSWNLPKHPAESAPTAATSTSAIPFTNRLPRMAVPLPEE